MHSWQAGKKYGKENLVGKEVHHIDGNKLNNDPENLILLTKDDHNYVTRYESKIKFLVNVILFLTAAYFVILDLLKTTILINRDIALFFSRFLIFCILLIALEINTHFISNLVRNRKENY